MTGPAHTCRYRSGVEREGYYLIVTAPLFPLPSTHLRYLPKVSATFRLV